MSYETGLGDGFPNLEQEQKKTLEDLLLEISLPEKQRSPEFFAYLERVWTRNISELDNWDATPEEIVYSHYLSKGKIQKQDLQKKILDLGCGNGEFIIYALEHQYGSQLYGVDKTIYKKHIPEKYQNHFKKADFSQKIPFSNNFDLILYSASIEQMAMENQEQEIKQSLKLALDKLMPDGQIKIFPLRNYPQIYRKSEVEKLPKEEKEELFEEIEKMKGARVLWDKILKELKDEGLIEYQIIPNDLEVRGRGDLYWLEEVLIITRTDKN